MKSAYLWIGVACCAACARPEARSASSARDSARPAAPVVAQAGDTAEDDEHTSSACLGKTDTIEVSRPTIIATVPSTAPVKDTATTPVPRDSAAVADSIEEADTDGNENEADTDFVLMALGACDRLHKGGITMYVNNYTTRMIRRRGVVVPMSFTETGFVFVDTSGVRHRQSGFLGMHRMLVLSDSLFGTKVSRGLEP